MFDTKMTASVALNIHFLYINIQLRFYIPILGRRPPHPTPRNNKHLSNHLLLKNEKKNHKYCYVTMNVSRYFNQTNNYVTQVAIESY